jgi:predicted negative regulator of RcsB-dependent stress response
MLQTIRQYGVKTLGVMVLTMISDALRAQDKVEIDTHEVKSWLETNWIWVVGGIILLLLLVMIGRSSRSRARTTDITGGERKTTTVVKDAQGNVQSVTTTEERL